MVPVGVWSLANPDLVERLKKRVPFNEADRITFLVVTEAWVKRIILR